MTLDRNNPVETFIEEIKEYSVPNTIKNCRSSLKSFFKIIDKDSSDYIVDIKKLGGEERENAINAYEEDMKKFWLALKDKAPGTRLCYMTHVKMFLSEFGIELSTKFWRDIHRRSPPSKAITDDIAPTNEQMKKILQHADLRAKALFLVTDSSGMRIGEVLRLDPDDIDMEKDPVRINVRAEITKTEQKRITFMSNEARDALLEWLKVRGEYLVAAVKKCKVVPSRQEDGKIKMVPAKKSVDDPRVFPFSYGNARQIWVRLLEKAELAQRDKRTGYHKMHIHCMRKRFDTNMPGYIGAKGEKITEELLGHTGYLSGAYRRLSESELAEGYKRGVYGLLIFEKGADLEKMRDLEEETEMQRSVMKRQEGEINRISAEKARMEQGMEEMAQKVFEKVERKYMSTHPELRKIVAEKGVQSPEVHDKIIDLSAEEHEHLETENKKKRTKQHKDKKKRTKQHKDKKDGTKQSKLI